MGAKAHRRPSSSFEQNKFTASDYVEELEANSSEQPLWEDEEEENGHENGLLSARAKEGEDADMDDPTLSSELVPSQSRTIQLPSPPATPPSRSKQLPARPVLKKSRTSLSGISLMQHFRRPSLLPLSPEETKLSGYLAKFRPTTGTRGMNCYETADLKSLISVSSLRELEVEHFMVNPKLRHDMNFERELRYRPNKEGAEAQIKSRREEHYWTAVEVELEMYTYFLYYEGLTEETTHSKALADTWLREFRSRQRRLPRMFRSMRSIILSMTPQHEISWVKDALDVDLIMQEIEKGQFDMGTFAKWTATWMKTHCAPIRDQYVDMMVRKAMVTKAAGSNAKEIVDVLRALFLMLENMKLDVANHQIVQLRPKMLKGFTNFERGFFLDQMARKYLQYEPMLSWYHQRKHAPPLLDPRPDSSRIPPNLAVFVNKFISSLLFPIKLTMPSLQVAAGSLKADDPPESDKVTRLILDFPPSFEFDRDRLEHLHQDLHSLVYTDICLLKISSLLQMNKVPNQRPQVIEVALRTFRVILWDIVRDDSDSGAAAKHGYGSAEQMPFPTLPIPLARWSQSSIGNIAVEMVRCVVSVFTTEIQRYRRQSQPPKIPDSIIDERVHRTEEWLKQNLQPTSELFRQRKEALRQRMVQRVTDAVHRLRKMNPLAVFQRLIPNESGIYNTYSSSGPSTSSSGAGRIANNSSATSSSSRSSSHSGPSGFCSVSACNSSNSSSSRGFPKASNVSGTSAASTSRLASRSLSSSSPLKPRAITAGAASILADKKKRVFDATVRLHNAAIEQGPEQNREPQIKTHRLADRSTGDAVFEGVLRRVAHIAVLHWWVWSPIIYFEEAIESGEPSSSSAAASSSVSSATAAEGSAAAIASSSARPASVSGTRSRKSEAESERENLFVKASSMNQSQRRATIAALEMECKRRRVFSEENEEAVLFLDDLPEGDERLLGIDEHAVLIDEDLASDPEAASHYSALSSSTPVGKAVAAAHTSSSAPTMAGPGEFAGGSGNDGSSGDADVVAADDSRPDSPRSSCKSRELKQTDDTALLVKQVQVIDSGAVMSHVAFQPEEEVVAAPTAAAATPACQFSSLSSPGMLKKESPEKKALTEDFQGSDAMAVDKNTDDGNE